MNYTNYQISSWNSTGTQITGHAIIIANDPIIYLNHVLQSTPITPLTSGSFEIDYRFLIVEFSITLSSGRVISGTSGRINLNDFYRFENGSITQRDSNDSWALGSYFAKTSGVGCTNLETNLGDAGFGKFHDLLSSPIHKLPDSFAILKVTYGYDSFQDDSGNDDASMLLFKIQIPTPNLKVLSTI